MSCPTERLDISQHHKLLLLISFPGLLCTGSSFHSSQRLQNRICPRQQDRRTSVHASAELQRSGLGLQCEGSRCLASSQLPPAAGVSGGTVLRGRLPLNRIHLWARPLSLHQQQGGAARVRQTPSNLKVLPPFPVPEKFTFLFKVFCCNDDGDDLISKMFLLFKL